MQSLINETTEKENVLKTDTTSKRLYIKKRLKYKYIVDGSCCSTSQYCPDKYYGSLS